MSDEQPHSTPEKSKRRSAGEWRPQFLATLRATGNVRQSCRAAGIDRRTAYNARDASAEFRQQWQDALDDAIDGLELLAWQRARSISDTLMIFLLKAHRPGLYRDTINIEVYIRQQAELLGLDPDLAVAEAQAILRETSTGR